MNSRTRNTGFTLIEVAVAMAVVAVSFIALYQSMQGMFAVATLMQEKTFASWVAFDQISELRIASEYPEGDKREGEIEMAGINWLYSMEFDKVTDDYQQIIVRVSSETDPDNILAVATGALLRPAQTGGGPAGPAGGGGSPGESATQRSNSGGQLLPSGANDGSPASPVPGAPGEGVLQ